jgi:hypothetical protein
MNEPNANDARPPRPELLAAYLDGELDAATRAEVEAWLAAHPDAAAEVEGQRRVLRLWRATPPPEPTQARWTTVFLRIEAAVAGLPYRGRRGWRALFWAAGVTAAAVAAAVAGSWMLHRPQTPTPAPAVVNEEDSPLLLVAADDVDIISMDGDDEDRLIVGAPPVSGPIVLASNGDIALEPIDQDQDGMQGVKMKEGLAGPMLVVPLDATIPQREE